MLRTDIYATPEGGQCFNATDEHLCNSRGGGQCLMLRTDIYATPEGGQCLNATDGHLCNSRGRGQCFNTTDGHLRNSQGGGAILLRYRRTNPGKVRKIDR